MLLIVDANCANETLCSNPSPDFKPVMSAIVHGKRKIVVGGSKQKAEYQRLIGVWRFLRSLDQAGRALMINDGKVDFEQAYLEKNIPMASDDPHVLALARVSGARLLCSYDQALHADFCNKAIIDRPRGKVYQNAGHARLLRQHNA